MKKSHISRILIEGNPELLQSLSGEIEASYSIDMVRPPEKSLVMAKAKDTVSGEPFYFGEILVTECTVSIENRLGIGILMGERPDEAYALAIVDAAINARLPETAAWSVRLQQEEQRIRERHLAELALNARTKVHFDTMEEYHARG